MYSRTKPPATRVRVMLAGKVGGAAAPEPVPPPLQATRGSASRTAQSATAVAYKSASDPFDLHLTGATLQQPAFPQPGMIYIRDNPNTTCVMKGINNDIDDQTRPFPIFCDLGADEYQ